ncbi:MAG: hypothetical protein WA463_11270 [Terriglobales bacterium]
MLGDCEVATTTGGAGEAFVCRPMRPTTTELTTIAATAATLAQRIGAHANQRCRIATGCRALESSGRGAISAATRLHSEHAAR